MGNGTSIGRVRGLGSAHSGAGTWLNERLTGVASMIVSLYLLFSLLMLPSYNYLTVHAWISHPIPATATIRSSGADPRPSVLHCSRETMTYYLRRTVQGRPRR